MSATLDLRRPARKKRDALAANDVEFVDGTLEDQLELERPLEREAKRVGLVPAGLLESLVSELGFGLGLSSSFEAIVAQLEESAHYDPDQHPRWPKGTPGGLGGQFMTVGQRFKLKGVEYDVSQVFPGHIYANVATKGIKGTPASVEIKADTTEIGPDGKPHPVITAVERPPAEPIHGAKAQTTSASFTGTVVDPYVYPETHDPSIAIPAGSSITPAQWNRFGKQDQERYAQVQELYGPWTASAAQGKVNAILKNSNTHTVGLLKSGHSAQINQSTGYTLSFHSIFQGVKNLVKGTPQVESKRTEFEQVRALQHEVAGVLQWDLYNRTKSPDVAVFHRTHELSLFQNEVIGGNKPVFAGLSQSQKWDSDHNTNFGDNTFATPMAIRHVVMFRDAANISSSGLAYEKEVANEDAYAADDRSFAWASGGITSMQKRWLTKRTINGAPGSVIDELRASMADGGANLPVPPADPVLVMDSDNVAKYVTPPKEATTGIGKLAYAELDEKGLPVAHSAKDLDLHPGDYIEGMKGTRYIIVADSSYNLGITYYKVTDLGTKVPGTETSANGVPTSAFSGHNDHAGNPEAYHFEQDGKLPFKKLAGHYNLPVYSSEFKGDFNPDAWAFSGADDAKMLSKFEGGEFFKLDGTFYKVVDQLGVGQTKVQSQTTGKYGKINSDYKSVFLVLKDGYSPSGQVMLSPDDFFTGKPVTVGAGFDAMTPGSVWMAGKTLWTVDAQQPDGHVQMSQSSGVAKNIGKQHVFDATAMFTPMTAKPPNWMPPEVGDTLAVDGKKATVTKLLKSGEVQINLAPGVLKLKQSDPLLAGVFSPAKWTVGDKVKLKDLPEGSLVHGGTGAKVRPYQVVAHVGTNVTIRNLDTGETLDVSGGKSYAQLIPKPSAAVLATPTAIVPPPESLSSSFDPSQWETGEPMNISELAPGMIIEVGGVPMKVEGWETAPALTDAATPSTGIKLTSLVTGQVGGVAPLGDTFTPYKLKGAPSPPPLLGGGEKYQPGMVSGDLDAYETFGQAKPLSLLGVTKNTLIKSKTTGKVWVVQDPVEGVAQELPSAGVAAPFLSQAAHLSKDALFFLLSPKAAEAAPLPADLPSHPGWVKNTSHTTLGDMEPGDLFSAADDKNIIWKVDGPEGTAGVAHTTVWSESAEPGVSSASSAEWEPPWLLPKEYLAKPVQATASPVKVEDEKGTVYIAGFNPTAYAPATVETTTLADLKVNAIFKGKSGVYMQVNGHSANGKSTYATNLTTGKATKLASSVKPAALMMAKTSPGYDDLEQGSPVALGALDPGDQYVGLDGLIGQVVEKADLTDEEPHVVTAPVLADGSLGNPVSLGNAPLNHVLFKAKAADAAPPMPPPALPGELDVDSLPEYKIEPYQYAHSGKNHYPKLAEVPEGSYVVSKLGVYLKVIKGGSNTLAVTDGETLYKIDGELRVKHVEPDAMPAWMKESLDSVPGIAPATPEGNEALLVKGKLVANTGAKTLAQLGLNKDDWFTGDGDTEPHKIVVLDIDGDAKVHDGDAWYSSQFEPESFWKADGSATGPSWKIGPLEFTAKPSANPDDYEDGPLVKVTEMQAGQVFKGTGGAVFVITANNGDGTVEMQNLTAGKPPFHFEPLNPNHQEMSLIPKAGSAALADPDVAPPDVAPVMGGGEFVKNSTAKPISSFPVGTLFQSVLDPTYVWKLGDQASDGSGDYSVEVVKAPGATEVGYASKIKGDYIPGATAPPEAAPAGVPAAYDLQDFTINDLNVTVGQLPVGSLFADEVDGGYVYKKTGDASMGLVPYEVVWPPLSQGAHDTIAASHAPGLVSQPPSVPAAPSGGPSTDPADYVAGKPVTLSELPEGAIFQSLSGTLFQKMEKTEAGTWPATNLKTGVVMGPLLGSMPVTPMTPKPDDALPPTKAWDDFVLGDEAWTLGGKHGVFMSPESGPAQYEKAFLIDGDPVPHQFTGPLYVSDPLAPSGKPTPPAASPAIDAATFTKNAKDANEAKQLGDFPVGTLVTLTSADDPTVWKVTGTAGPEKAVAMEVVKTTGSSLGPSDAKVGTQGDLPNAHLPSSYQLPPGFMEAGKLQTGDDFVPPGPDGSVYTVTSVGDQILMGTIKGTPPAASGLPQTLPFGKDLIVQKVPSSFDPSTQVAGNAMNAWGEPSSASLLEPPAIDPLDPKTMPWESYPKKKISEMPIGTYFAVSVQHPADTPSDYKQVVWQLVAKEPHPELYAGQASEPTDSDALVVFSQATPPNLGKHVPVTANFQPKWYVEPGQATAAPVEQIPFADLDIGSEFVYQDAPWKKIAPATAQLLEPAGEKQPGYTTPFSDEMVTPTARPAAQTGKLTSATVLKPGMLIQVVDPSHPGPAIWKVTGIKQDGKQVDTVIAKASAGTGNAMSVGFEKTFYRPDLNKGEWKVVSPADLEAAPVNPLVGYLYAHSGKKKFPKLTELAPGVVFQDKGKKQYVHVGPAHAGYATIKAVSDGEEFVVPAETRVFVVKEG